MFCRFALAVAATLALSISAAGAEEPVHRIGVLGNVENPEATRVWLDGLREHGWVDRTNLRIEYRRYQGRSEQIPALVAELVASRPEVIVAIGPRPAVAIHAAAPTIPLVFRNLADPVALGLVESFARPGGHATGFTTVSLEGFTGKSIQLLKELVPRASQIAILVNPTNPIHQQERAKLPEIARVLGVEIVVVEASTPGQFEMAFETAHAQGAEAVEVGGDALTFAHSAEVVARAAQYRLPAMYFERQYVLDGGLVSYGARQEDNIRGVAGYVDKILRGEKPGDLPVQQPTRCYLTINLKTAATLGITAPPSLLGVADEVIE
jgi:putative ABC transport system substrate-binding protein